MLRLILVGCLVVIARAGVARAEDVPDHVRLRVSFLPQPTSTEPEGIASQRIVAEFQARHPEVELVPAEGLKIETVTSEAKTIMMIVGGIAPDVFLMNFRSIDSFVRQGMVAPLDEFIAHDKANGRDVMARVLPQVVPVITREGPEKTRGVYALPGSFLVVGLYFNREIFRAADLPERAPKDWQEMVAFARAIQQANPRFKGLLLNGGTSASWNLMNFLWSAGGDAVKETQPNEWRAVFDSPEAVAAYEFYYQLVEADRLAGRLTGTPTPQELEKFGMAFRYIGDITQLDPELWGFGAVPLGPTGKRGSEVNAQLYGIYSGVKDPKVKQAAWDYISFVTSEDAERIRVGTFVELGQASQVSPTLLRKYGFTEFLNLIPEGLEKELTEALENGRPEPYGRNCNLVYSEMTYPLDQILLSGEIRRDWQKGDKPAVRSRIQEILQRAVHKTDERMIGYVPPEQMKMRRAVASVVVLAILIIFGAVGWFVSNLFSRGAATMNRPTSSRTLTPWLCLAPALLLISVWHYLPLARGTVMAFLDYQIILKSTFVGLDNFANVLFDNSFWNSLLATLHYAAWTLTIGFLMPVLLAYALHLIPRHKVLYRTLYYLPAVISGTAVFFLWRELFGMEGVLNQALRLIGFEARRAWTEDPYLAMISCVLPGIWAGAGPGCLIYLAALKTIPEEQFEAAEIDGAGFFQKTVKIIYPGLRALLGINFIGAVAAAFHGATNILVMTGGGPNGLTEVTSLLIFYEGFIRLKFGTATAMAWILGSMLIGFTVLQLKRLSQMEFKTAR